MCPGRGWGSSVELAGIQSSIQESGHEAVALGKVVFKKSILNFLIREIVAYFHVILSKLHLSLLRSWWGGEADVGLGVPVDSEGKRDIFVYFCTGL